MFKPVHPLHTYIVCLLFDSINAVQVRVSYNLALWFTGPAQVENWLVQTDKWQYLNLQIYTGIQFEWNKDYVAAKEMDYSHCEMGWVHVNNSTNILKI